MVMFKRELKLWQETGVTQRALMIRDDADANWLAVEMQHERIVAGLRSRASHRLISQKIDVDFFFMALHRLVLVAELAQQVSDPRKVMTDALAIFGERTAGMMLSETDEPATIMSVRHALEHGLNLERRGGLGFGTGENGWFVSYRDRIFETKDLREAARDLHLAVRKAVDPEAFADFGAGKPFLELRDPAAVEASRRHTAAMRIGSFSRFLG